MKQNIIILITVVCCLTIFLLNSDQIYYKRKEYLIKKSIIDCDIENSYFELIEPKFKYYQENIVLPIFGSDHDSMYKLLYSKKDSIFIVEAKYSVFPHKKKYYGCTGSHSLFIYKILSY